MTAIYIRWIKAGKMLLSDVPAKWREEVEKALEEGRE